MSVDDEYHAHKRREEARYVLAFDEFEKNLTPLQRRMLGAAAVPDVEDPRSHSSRRVSLGVLTDAAERVSASYSPNVAEAVDGTQDNPSPELLAEMLGIPLDLVRGAVVEDLNPMPETLAECVGLSLDAGFRIFEWHNKAAARNAERIRMRAIVRIAGVFLDCANTKLAAAGLTFAGGLALQYGLGSIQDYAASIDVSRAAITKNVKFWQGELDLPERLAPELRHPNLSDQHYLVVQKLAAPSEQKPILGRGILAWHHRAAARKAEKIKVRAIERIVGGFLDCANSKLTAAGLAYAADLALTAGLGTMQDYALKIAVSRAAISKNAKFWQRELGLPAASNMRAAEKCRAYSEAQKAKHWRNQKFTLVGV
jgi:hypothetical protein